MKSFLEYIELKEAYTQNDLIERAINTMEKVPQPGPTSGTSIEDTRGLSVNTKYLNINEIFEQIKDIPYYNNVLSDILDNDYSWEVTNKVIEYANYLKSHPESIQNLPPIIVVNGKLDDGAHRISAIYLLKNHMDKNNLYWSNVQLRVDFYTNQ
jgi:hypothetical protein